MAVWPLMPLYLAKISAGRESNYELRQSYARGDGGFTHRTIFALGPNPGQFIEPFGDNTVLFAEDLLAAVEEADGGNGDLLLEQLLSPFLPAEIRRRLALFPPRSRGGHGPLSAEEEKEIHRQVHLFDRRRLYYLRYGAVDQSRLSRLHEKCCRPLLGQSRDEREYYFAGEERALQPTMYFQYIYAIFSVAKHFQQGFASWFPEALARDQVDDLFIHELCRLNRDATFFPDDYGGALHPHLRRYVVMYFDHIPGPRSFHHDFAAAFMAGRRRFHWPKQEMISPQQVSAIFAMPLVQLERMSLPQLGRLYRQLAMRLHPDQGGDHEAFIALTEAYKQLRRSKKK
jgi:hypothetical protein